MLHHTGVQHVRGPWPVDSVADVLLRHDRLSGGHPVSERDHESQQGTAVYLWILERVLHLRRNHEPGQHTDDLWAHHKDEPAGPLHIRRPGGHGASHSHSHFPVVHEPAYAGETGAD